MLPAKRPCFENRFVELLSQETSDDPDVLPLDEQFYFPDKTTEFTLTWKVTSDEWQQVFAALNYGADFAYPSGAIDTVAIFLRMVTSDMSFCDTVAECIETNAATQAALQAFLSGGGNANVGNGDTAPTTLSPARTSENLLPAGYTCDNNHLFGMARFIVQNLHDATLQLLQALELTTNDIELLATFVDNVEATSWAGSAIELAAWLQDQLIEYYEASWSSSVDDTLSCAVFCAIKDECLVSLDNVLAAYAENIISTPPDVDDWIEILSWLTGLSFSASIGTVATFHYFVLQALRFGSKALNFVTGLRSLELIIALGADDTDSDWSILCTECEPPARIPVVATPCGGGGSAGTNIVNVFGNTWQIDSTTRVGIDEGITIKEASDLSFKLSNVTNIEPAGFYGFLPTPGVCTVQATPPDYATVTFLEMAWTLPLGTPFTIQFDMTPP